jgi:dihydroorotate dehydrogenase
MGLYQLARPVIFALDAERAHRLTLAALKLKPAGDPPAPDPILGIRIAGIDFPNPIGLAAGFDKDAEVPDAMLGLGFGFVEIGTITPRPQAGNPRPRLFRLVEDEAVINRMGFNNGGQPAALARLQARSRQGGAGQGIVGVNLGANKDSADRMADYADGVRLMTPVADYLVVNISSPNTPGLRALQDPAALAALLELVMATRGHDGPPLFLKVAPDLEPADIDDIARVAMDARIEGLIVSNTTIARPPLKSARAGEAGGLSGAPLRDAALQRLKDFRTATGGALPLIGVGGIASGEDAYRRILAGASLVQLYSALAYQGPGLVRRIARELKQLLERDGFTKTIEAVGEG